MPAWRQPPACSQVWVLASQERRRGAKRAAPLVGRGREKAKPRPMPPDQAAQAQTPKIDKPPVAASAGAASGPRAAMPSNRLCSTDTKSFDSIQFQSGQAARLSSSAVFVVMKRGPVSESEVDPRNEGRSLHSFWASRGA